MRVPQGRQLRKPTQFTVGVLLALIILLAVAWWRMGAEWTYTNRSGEVRNKAGVMTACYFWYSWKAKVTGFSVNSGEVGYVLVFPQVPNNEFTVPTWRYLQGETPQSGQINVQVTRMANGAARADFEIACQYDGRDGSVRCHGGTLLTMQGNVIVLVVDEAGTVRPYDLADEAAMPAFAREIAREAVLQLRRTLLVLRIDLILLSSEKSFVNPHFTIQPQPTNPLPAYSPRL